MKATDHLRTVQQGRFIAVRIERAHLRRWLAEPMPTFLIVYDGPNDTAYWLDIQNEFGGVKRFHAASGSETLTAHIPKAQILNRAAIQHFREIRESAIMHVEGGSPDE